MIGDTPLSQNAALNIQMDSIGNDYQLILDTSGMTTNPPLPHLAQEQWSIWHNDIKISSPNYEALYDCLSLPSICTYWTTSHTLKPFPRLNDASYDLVDWTAVASFMAKLTPSRRRWCTKHASEQCGVDVTLQHWNLQEDTLCPWCNLPETCHHVLLCPAHGANDPWEKHLQKLSDILTTLSTPPPILEAIMLCLTEWRQGKAFLNPPTWDPWVIDIISHKEL